MAKVKNKDSVPFANKLIRYQWLIDYISRHTPTFNELSEAWKDAAEVGASGNLSQRTFNNYRDELSDNYGIQISCNRSNKAYEVKIDEDHLCDEFQVAIREVLLNASKAARRRSNEEQLIKQGRIIKNYKAYNEEFLDIIIQKIADNEELRFSYQSYYSDKETEFWVEPYALKQYENRWYLWCNDISSLKGVGTFPQQLRFIALDDRIKKIYEGGDRFNYSDDYAQRHKDYFGVITGYRNQPPMLAERVLLKAYTKEKRHKYLNSAPLHHSQKWDGKIYPESSQGAGDEYCIFEYNIAPTYDFIQKIFSFHEEVEVLEPLSLRNKMQDLVEKMSNHYNK